MRSKYCLLMLSAAAVMLSSCSIIDEDNSDCGLDNKIVYRLKLRTNIQTELDEQLGTEEERLMSEGVSFCASARVPIVYVNVQRGGPGIGTIQPAQQDYTQATKASGNGGFRMRVFSPSTVWGPAETCPT